MKFEEFLSGEYKQQYQYKSFFACLDQPRLVLGRSSYQYFVVIVMTPEEQKQWDEIHRRIGRNVALLQRLELAIKYVLSRGNFSIKHNFLDPNADALNDRFREHLDSFSQKTLGCVSRQFGERILIDPEDDFTDETPLEKGEGRVRCSLVHGNKEQQNQLREELSLIVEARNRIVHQLFSSFDLSSLDGRKELASYLDEQHQKVIPVFNRFCNMAESLQKAAKLFSELPANFSVLPKDCLENFCFKELVVIVQYYAAILKKTNGDGWTNLAAVGNFIQKKCPEALAECQRKYGVKKLKTILLRLGLFDVDLSERSVVYRMKPEYWIKVTEKGELFMCKRVSDSPTDGFLEEALNMWLEIEGQV